MKTKKTLKIDIILYAILAAVLAACSSAPSAPGTVNGYLGLYDYYETIPAVEGSSSGAEMDLSFRLIEAKIADLQSVVRSTLYAGRSAEEYAAAVTGDWKNSYRQTLEEDADWGEDQNWSYDETHDFQINGGYAILSQAKSYYQGGAHGMSEKAYYVLDILKARVIPVDEILPLASRKSLETAVQKALYHYVHDELGMDVEEWASFAEMGFTDSPELGSYYPAEKGIVFTWNPYEIAPYSYGIVPIILSWEELDPFLSPSGKVMEAAYKR
jgi:hypothetical protein